MSGRHIVISDSRNSLTPYNGITITIVSVFVCVRACQLINVVCSKVHYSQSDRSTICGMFSL